MKGASKKQQDESKPDAKKAPRLQDHDFLNPFHMSQIDRLGLFDS